MLPGVACRIPDAADRLVDGSCQMGRCRVDMVGELTEAAAESAVARRFGLAAETGGGVVGKRCRQAAPVASIDALRREDVAERLGHPPDRPKTDRGSQGGLHGLRRLLSPPLVSAIGV